MGLESYEFVVSVNLRDNGKFEYAIMQEFYEGDCGDPDWELLESGEADTLEEAADMAGKSIRSLFVVK